MAVDHLFNPELRPTDGTVIRNRADALAFLRAQEARPGVDDRDELLHLIERANDPDAMRAAVGRFREWLRELEILDARR